MKKVLFIIAVSVSSLVMAQTTTKNYIKSEAYQVPVQNQTEIDNLVTDNKIETITYYDELGRPIQSVAKQAGGNKEDIITPVVYDDLGRKTKQYLPFARNTPSLNYELPEDLLPAIENYYATKFSDDLTIINPNVFSETLFETSPLNQTLEQGAPGQDWAIDSESDTNHTIKFDYLANVQDEVERFTVVFPTGSTELPQPFFNGYYNAGTLYKTITKDENWSPNQTHLNDHTTEEFKDKQGRVILKRNYNNNLAHDAQYIYDDFGNLTYVLSPNGSDAILTENKYKKPFTQTLKGYQFLDKDKYGNPVVSSSGDATVSLDDINETLTVSFNINFASATELLNGNIALLDDDVPDVIIGTVNELGGTYIVSVQDNFLHISGSGAITQMTGNFTVNLPSYSPDPNVLNDLCYQYHYDYRNRLIEKKIPGKDWESIVYDKLDRPVLTQDALLKQNNEWLFTKYDALGRVVYTGKLLDIDNNRSEFQTLLSQETLFYEEHTSGTTTVAGTVLNYTNQAFPSQNVIEVLTVNYYDTYSDLGGLSLPAQNAYGHTITTNTKSLPTVSKVRVLDTNDWITTITGYDDKARPVYVSTQNDYLNTTDTVDSHLDFVGKVLQITANHSKTNHPTVTTIDDFTYDHAARLLSQKQEIVGQGQERIVENYYDELGQLEKKDVGGETVFDGYTDIVGVEVNETTGIINKTAYTSWTNAGIATKGKFRGDGYVEFEAVQTNKHVFVGLTPLNINELHSSVLYYIFLQDNGVLTVREDTNGDGTAEWIGSFGSYQIGDVFRVERAGTQIVYKKNGTIFYTSNQTATTQSLLGDASIVHQNAKIKNLKVASSNLNTVLQTVDYTYNIRGWLKGINDNGTNGIGEDLFSFKLNYNNPTQGTALYNGNISETLWQTTNDDITNVDSRSYVYSYDALNRITEAIFDKTGGTNQDGFYNLKHVDYDKNGNIGVLRRSGVDPNNNDAFIDNMDNLTYTYTGNQLLKVAENAGHTEGFKDGANAGDDYTYDANGNMLTDENKGITNISYNHLNLPTQVTTSNGNITYIYDASGIKLKKQVNETGQNTASTLYAGNFIYEDTQANGEVLKFFSQPEGYTEPIDATDLSLGYNYVYQYKDHLGNIRLSYSDTNKDGAIGTGEIIEENNYYPFGMLHSGYNNAVSANSNSSASKFKYNGIELEEALGIDLYEMSLRLYDPTIGRWNSLDPVIHYDFSTYSAFDNNPVIFADPSGADAWTHVYGNEYINTRTGESTNDANRAIGETVGEVAGPTDWVLNLDTDKYEWKGDVTSADDEDLPSNSEYVGVGKSDIQKHWDENAGFFKKFFSDPSIDMKSFKDYLGKELNNRLETFFAENKNVRLDNIRGLYENMSYSGSNTGRYQFDLDFKIDNMKINGGFFAVKFFTKNKNWNVIGSAYPEVKMWKGKVNTEVGHPYKIDIFRMNSNVITAQPSITIKINSSEQYEKIKKTQL